MTQDFARTTRSVLEEAHERWVALLGVGFILVTLWVAWFVISSVEVYLATDDARIEVSQLVHPVRADVGGRVSVSHAVLDKRVRANEVLVELDKTKTSLELQAAQAELRLNEQLLEDVERLKAAEQAVIAEMGVLTQIAVDETRARAERAAVRARFSDLRAKRNARLHAEGVLAEVESERLLSDAQGRRSLARAERLAARRMAADQRTAIRDRQVDLARLALRTSEIQVELEECRARIRQLEVDMASHSIRAPVGGRLGWVADVSTGLVLEAGDQVATVVPEGELRVVAYYPAGEAQGRVRAGQNAVLRLSAYPWTQYGVVRGQVDRVASEPAEDRLRVEVALDTVQPKRLPLEHGLRGALEIVVEWISPLTLLLRAVGTMDASPRPVELRDR